MDKCTFITSLLPLWPGMDKLGTSECYRRGKATQPTHRGVDCIGENRIPVREGQWRSYVTKYLQGSRNNFQTPNRNPAISRIAVTEDGVAYDSQLYPAETMMFTDEQGSGNGWEARM